MPLCDRVRSSITTCAVGVWVVLASSEAHAQGAEAVAVPANSVALSWVRLPGAETCSSPQSIARAVQARVGGEVLVGLARADWSIEGRIERRGRTWVATLAAARAPGEQAMRTLERVAPDCAAIDEQVVTVIALLLDAHSARPRPAQAPAAAPPCPPSRVVERTVRVVVPVPRVIEREAVTRRRGVVDLALGGAFEALSRPSFAAQLAGEWTVAWPTARLRVGLTFVGVSRDTVAWSAGQMSVNSLALSASAAICLSHPRAPWLAMCPGLSGGVAYGAGEERATRREALLPIASLTLRSHGEIQLSSRWSARLWSELGVNVLRPRFAVVDEATQRALAESSPDSPVSLSAGASISLHFGSETR